MDREELDQRIRTRRPGEGGVRRGTPLDEWQRDARPAGYVPFQPEPEDAMAAREPDADQSAARVDNTSPGFDSPQHPGVPAETRPVPPPPYAAPRADYRPPAAEPVAYEPQAYQPPLDAPDHEGQSHPPPEYEREEHDPAAYDEPFDPEPYGAPEDAYPYPYRPADDGRRRGGSGALPVIGFIVLCVLALGVGAVLAGLLGGDPGVGEASPTPSASETAASSVEPSVEPSAPSSGEASATAEPTDGPVTFPDGALIQVQACATQGMSFDGCDVDGSTISEPTMWVWIGFDDAQGSDTFLLTLRSDGQTIDQQEKVLGDVLDCPGSCSGYLIGAAYRDLEAGDYELVVRRNDDFADSATFSVEG